MKYSRDPALFLLGVVVAVSTTYADVRERHVQQNSYTPENVYATCIDGALGVHIEMTTCIENEIDRINENIESQLANARPDSSLEELWARLDEGKKAWTHSVNTNCALYHLLGGQRADLLNKVCVLEEVKFREVFINTLLIDAQD
jgi:hypothetical protein